MVPLFGRRILLPSGGRNEGGKVGSTARAHPADSRYARYEISRPLATFRATPASPIRSQCKPKIRNNTYHYDVLIILGASLDCRQLAAASGRNLSTSDRIPGTSPPSKKSKSADGENLGVELPFTVAAEQVDASSSTFRPADSCGRGCHIRANLEAEDRPLATSISPPIRCESCSLKRGKVDERSPRA